jgi:WD40 repeat protein
VVALAACGRIGFDATPDAAHVLVPHAIDELNGGAFSDDPALRGDELEIVWTSERTATGCDVYASQRASLDTLWGSPTAVIATPACDATPALSFDGLTLWFASAPGGIDWQLFEATRPNAGAAWSQAAFLAELDSANDDLGITVTSDGLLVIFYSDRTGTFDLFAASRATTTDVWSTPALITELATPAMERSPHISADGTQLWFTSDRDGNEDIFVATRAARSESFRPPIRVDAINTPVPEDDPWVSLDNKRIYFARNEGTMAQLWVAPL